MMKEDFEELLSYTNIHDSNDVRIAIKAGGEILKVKANDFIMLSQALGVHKDSIRHWFEGRQGPKSVEDRKYVLNWITTRIENTR